jgi:hypothetical protein
MSDIDNKNKDNQQQIDHGFEKYKEEMRKSTAQRLSNNSEDESGWARLFYGFGVINFLVFAIALVNFLGVSNHDRAEYLYLLIVGLGGGLTCFFFGYVTQILSDCRRYLKKISDGK